MTAAALNLFSQEHNALPELINRYLETNRISITELAARTDMSRTTLSRYLANKYDGNIAAIEETLRDYLRDNGVSVDNGAVHSSIPLKTTFFESVDAMGVTGVCSSCQEFLGVGIVVGRSGYGKSHTLRRYATLPGVAYLECDSSMGINDVVEAIERALGLSVGTGTVWKRLDAVCGYLNMNGNHLIVVDEADKLIERGNIKKMELLRTIVDKSDVGLVLAGEPALEGALKSALPRFANRVDFYYSLKGLTKEEVARYLGAFPFDAAALTEMQERAMNNRHGCFRLLDRTLNNVIRLMRDGGCAQVDLRLIEQASAMMMM